MMSNENLETLCRQLTNDSNYITTANRFGTYSQAFFFKQFGKSAIGASLSISTMKQGRCLVSNPAQHSRIH